VLFGKQAKTADTDMFNHQKRQKRTTIKLDDELTSSKVRYD